MPAGEISVMHAMKTSLMTDILTGDFRTNTMKKAKKSDPGLEVTRKMKSVSLHGAKVGLASRMFPCPHFH